MTPFWDCDTASSAGMTGETRDTSAEQSAFVFRSLIRDRKMLVNFIERPSIAYGGAACCNQRQSLIVKLKFIISRF